MRMTRKNTILIGIFFLVFAFMFIFEARHGAMDPGGKRPLTTITVREQSRSFISMSGQTLPVTSNLPNL